MRIVSTVWAILSLFLMLIGFFPCLGWTNWFNVPFAALGLVIASAALLVKRDGSVRGGYAFPVLSFIIAIILGLIRLHLGLGVF